MKPISFLFLFLNFGFVFAQEELEFKVLDKLNNSPIFGASILVNNKPVGFSDDLGNYVFDLTSLSQLDEICISHISYTKSCFPISNLLKSKLVVLNRATTFLDEVVIKANKARNEKVRPLVRTIKKQHKKTKSGFYWSEMNLKQMVYRENTPQNYLEINGFIFMLDHDKVKNAFKFPIIVPRQVRRTEETEFQKKQDFKRNQKRGVLQNSIHEIGGQLPFFYRVFENLHPLKNNFNEYDFEYTEHAKESSNIKEYVIDYKRIKPFKVRTRLPSNIYGKMFFDKKTNTILREEVSFHFENSSIINMRISYQIINDKRYPLEIISKIFKLPNKELGISNQRISTVLRFNKIDTKERENYWEIAGNFFPFYVSDFSYNKEFWDLVSIKNNPFIKDINKLTKELSLHSLFQRGSKSKVYDENSLTYKTLLPGQQMRWSKLKELIKKDLKTEI